MQSNGLNLDTIKFRNIRDIPYVKDHAEFFAESFPIYFRVDLAKALTADFVLQMDKLPFVINIDSDVAAIVRAQLFDYPTLLALEKLGYVFGSAGEAEEENSFIMLHNGPNLKTLKLHKEAIIDLSTAKALKETNRKILEQLVFLQYKGFKTAMKVDSKDKAGKTRRSQNIQPRGKYMIFPRSQFSTMGGYSDKEIELLKDALLTAPLQNEALMAN